jgi:Fe-S cluster assembly ATP-binding protein
MHLVMQYPSEVPGVDLTEMLAEAYSARGRSTDGLAASVAAEAERIHFPSVLLDRSLNVDLSGGEKKRNETLQLALLQPKFAILDELDSGLDIDALRDCSRRVEAATHDSQLGVLAITHYNRLLEELHPDHVHILVKGRIVASGGPDLADQLERDGYEAFTGGEVADAPASSGSYDDLFAL